VAVLRALLIVVAVAAVAAVPCLVGLAIIYLDEAIERSYRAVRRGLRRLRAGLPKLRRRRRRRVTRLARGLWVPWELAHAEPSGPPIEQLAADLRRLTRQRLGIATRSPIWASAVQRAYDDRLKLACDQLGIVEHLSELTGLDLEVERVRLEGTLEAQGLVVRDPDSQPRYEQR
jgi:hypothetical protein